MLKIKKKELSGINVTLPYKQKIIPFVDQLVNDAKSTNSVNTIFLDDTNTLVGENTDVFGLECALIKKLESSNKQSALILGAGGVVPSIIYALEKMKASRIIVSNRTKIKAENLKKLFKDLFPLLIFSEYLSLNEPLLSNRKNIIY